VKQIVRVFLTPQEHQEACYGGVNRRLRALTLHRAPNQPERKYHEQNWFQTSISGVVAEYAVAKAFGLQWEDLTEDPNGFDVLNYQVRSSENPDGLLKVRRRDNPDHKFIFARVRNNEVRIHGWSTGAQVISNNQETFPDCFEMPMYRLYPMTDLPEPIQWQDKWVTAYEQPRPGLGTVI
jgi:hypothetical protein